MSVLRPGDAGTGQRDACPSCLRRGRLLAELSPVLDRLAGDRARLFAALALSEHELLDALAGRRRRELAESLLRVDTEELAGTRAGGQICRHAAVCPPALRRQGADGALFLAGPTARLTALTAAPVVAIVGCSDASDYGIESARRLARGLAACGLTVAAPLDCAIQAAAHEGALEAGGACLATLSDGIDAPVPALRRHLHTRLMGNGCAVSELPGAVRGRRWGRHAAVRLAVGLAAVTVVVEARTGSAEMAAAAHARELGGPLGAVPGRVGSRLAAGPHELIRAGTRLVRDAADVLDMLPDARGCAAARGLGAGARGAQGGPARATLDSCSRRVLERVGAGGDTPDSLARPGEDPTELLLALSRLELRGLLGRGDGGRYVLRSAASAL